MSPMEKKNLSQPDEVRTSEKGRMELVTLGDVTIGRATLQPGWKWSTSLKPLFNHEAAKPHICNITFPGDCTWLWKTAVRKNLFPEMSH